MVLLSMFNRLKLSSSSSFTLGLFFVLIPLSISMSVTGEMTPAPCFFSLIISIIMPVSRRFI